MNPPDVPGAGAPGAARRVLYVSYYSPPYGGPQGFRAAQFIRHLPAHGWEPTLLTVKRTGYDDDPGPVDDISFRGARSGAIETGTLPLQALATRFRAGGEGAASGGPPQEARVSRKAKLAALVATPDRLAGWIPFAVARGLRAARRSDLIFAAGPPYTNHVAGMILARLTGTPLVVMVDDPWVSMSHRVWHGELQQRIHRRLERASLARADGILAGTEGFGGDIARRNPEAVGDKLTIVLWGYEPDDVPRDVPAEEAPPVRFVYAGSLRGAHYDPTGLFAALRRLLAEDPQLSRRLRFDFYGAATPQFMALAAGLEEVIAFHGFQPHREISAAIRRAHATVLLINDTHEELGWYTSAKLFTYAGSQRPTLALVPPGGDAARLVEARGLGIVAPPQDPEAIAAAVLRVERDHARLRDAIRDVSDFSSDAVVAAAAAAFGRAVTAGGQLARGGG